MNYFGAIRESISNVPHNISAGFKSFTSREEEKEAKLQCDGVSIDAGAQLLNKFQEQWSQIHEDSEWNATKAEEVDSTINQLYLQIERETDVMNEFLSHATYLPELVLSLDATMELMGELSGKMSDLESNLASLEDFVEETELQRNRRLHLNELKLYRERKSVQVEQAKAKLAREHADKAAAHESKLQATLQEKQTIFDETYSEAMQDYKIFGQTKLNTPGYRRGEASAASASGSGTPDLSSITLDEDTKELDAFLETDPEKTDEEKTDPEKTGEEKTDGETVKTEPEKTDGEKTEPEKTEQEKTDGETEKTDGEADKTEVKPNNETETTQADDSDTAAKDSTVLAKSTEAGDSEVAVPQTETETKSKTGSETETEKGNQVADSGGDKDNNNAVMTEAIES